MTTSDGAEESRVADDPPPGQGAGRTATAGSATRRRAAARSERAAPARPPEFTGTPEQVALGSKLYGRYCLVCHMGMFNNPVLARSPVLHDPQAMKSIVIDGALKHNGMASFRSVLTGPDVEAIRHYVIKRANDH